MFDRVERPERADGLVRKWLPQDLYSIDQMESWLTDMAAEGLFLVSIGACFAQFRRGGARNVRYRIDVLSRELTTDELVLYDSCGWHWVLTKEESRIFGGDIEFYVFQADEDATVPELHTDPMEQANSLRRLNRACILDALWALMFVLLFLGLSVYPMVSFHELGRFLLYGPTNGGWMQIPVWIFWTALYTGRWRSVRRLRKRLLLGEPLDHRAGYRRRFRYGVLRMAVPLGLIALLVAPLICAQAAGGGNFQSLLLPEGTPDFPVVRLTEFRGRGVEDGVEGETRHKWTVAGAVVDEIWEYGDYEEDGAQIELSTVCYRLPFAWTSTLAFDALLDDGFYEGIHENYYVGEITPVSTDLVDEAWAAAPAGDNGGRFALFVRDGRYIVQTFYSDHTTDFSGDPDAAAAYRDRCVERILPLLARRLNG